MTARQKQSCYQAVWHWGRICQSNTMIKATEKAKKRALFTPNSDRGEESSSPWPWVQAEVSASAILSLLCSSLLPHPRSFLGKTNCIKRGPTPAKLGKYRRVPRAGRAQKIPPPCLRGLAASLFPRQSMQDSSWARREASRNTRICLQ